MFSIFKPNLVDFFLVLPESGQRLPIKLKGSSVSRLKSKPSFDLDLAKSYISQDSSIMEILNKVSSELGFDKEDFFQKFLEILVIEDPEVSILLLELPKKVDKETFLESLKTYFRKFNFTNLNQVIAPDILATVIAFYAYAILNKDFIILTLDVVLLALNITNKMEMPEDFNPDVEYPEGTEFKGKGY